MESGEQIGVEEEEGKIGVLDVWKTKNLKIKEFKEIEMEIISLIVNHVTKMYKLLMQILKDKEKVTSI
jgi:hypothetical protein